MKREKNKGAKICRTVGIKEEKIHGYGEREGIGGGGEDTERERGREGERSKAHMQVTDVLFRV